MDEPQKKVEYFCPKCEPFPHSYFATKPRCGRCKVGEDEFQRIKKGLKNGTMEITF